MRKLKDFIKKVCYTPNSLRHDLEGELVFQHLKANGPFKSLLDAGAGGGGYTVEILNRGIADQVVSVEADDENYKILKERAKAFNDKVETHNCFLEETPIANGSMDAVICNQVLEHIEDHDRAAQKLVDSLRTGGFLVASVPRSPVALPQAEHVRDGYTEEEFGVLFSSKGMEILGFDWFYTLETQAIRKKTRRLARKNIFPPKFLYKVDELNLSAEERHQQSPMGLIVLARKN